MPLNTQLPYSLKLGISSSDSYFTKIAVLSSHWLDTTLQSQSVLIAGIQEYRQQNGLPERSPAELTFELLTLGVMLRERGGQAAGFPTWSVRALVSLGERQKKSSKSTRTWQALRGWILGWGSRLGTVTGRGELDALALARSAGMQLSLNADPDVGFTLYGRRLVGWLQAMGRSTLARRLTDWQDYIEGFEPQQSQELTLQALALAQEFEDEYSPLLKAYTRDIEHFIQVARLRSIWRHDNEVLTRTPGEYHLSLLGVEILNHAYRERFLKTHKKVAALPDCLCSQRAGSTKKLCMPAEVGKNCLLAKHTCQAGIIAALGKQTGFEISWVPGCRFDMLMQTEIQARERPGILAIACPLTALESVWELDDLGLPCQVLLLDCSSCPNHAAYQEDGTSQVAVQPGTILNFSKFNSLIDQEETGQPG